MHLCIQRENEAHIISVYVQDVCYLINNNNDNNNNNNNNNIKFQIEKVIETDEFKLLWDFPIQTDNKLDHNRPDIVVVNKSWWSCLLVDIACPFYTRIVKKEKEKIDGYQDWIRELK